MGQNDMFSIRQMIELTGISEFTLRGWENRYAAFSPQRSNTGRREYTKTDIERALLIRELLKRDHKISRIATLSLKKLQALFEISNHDQAIPDHQNDLVRDIFELLALQKWTELSILFQKVRFKSAIDLVRNFFIPLLQELAAQVEREVISVAQEHVLSSLLKEKIYSALSGMDHEKALTQNRRAKARFVLATPEGDHHEIGLLLAHLLIRSFGFTSLYLGPHTPAQDLSETALRFEATHLLIVSTVSEKNGARRALLNHVNEVQKKLGARLQILLAGSQASFIPTEQKINMQHLRSFKDLEQHLNKLGEKSV